MPWLFLENAQLLLGVKSFDLEGFRVQIVDVFEGVIVFYWARNYEIIRVFYWVSDVKNAEIDKLLMKLDIPLSPYFEPQSDHEFLLIGLYLQNYVLYTRSDS